MTQIEQVTERDTPTAGQLVMPFYLVCDVSYSMHDDMAKLNTALEDLRTSIRHEPAVDDLARIGLITFSDTARVVTPLSQVSKAQLPHLSDEGGTNYGAAFRRIAEVINADRDALAAASLKVYRPCVFFLTDGLPQDRDWLQTFDATLTYDVETGTGMKAYPVFIPFGFRDADPDVLSKLAYPKERGRWYLAENVTAQAALEGIRDIIMKTVMTASTAASRGQQQGVLQPQEPTPGSGVTSGPSNRIDDFIA